MASPTASAARSATHDRGAHSHVFPRHTKAKCRRWEDGKRYLDGSGGAAVSCLGHGDPDVRGDQDQLDRIAFAHTGFFTSEPAEALADLLIATHPRGMDRVYLVSGGSEAVEAAIKLAGSTSSRSASRQRHKLIARRQSYHGNTLGALAPAAMPGGARNSRRC
jgi:adenosylmethionine-8-amino-7-oxononanoate aminotransferase